MIGAVVGLTFSCFHADLEQAALPKWNPTFAFPAVKAQFTVADILKSAGAREFVKGDSNEILQINYAHNIFSKTGAELFYFPDLKFDLTLPKDTLNIQIPFPGENTIHKLHLKDFHIHYNIELAQAALDVGDTIRMKMDIPNAVKDGVSFTEVVSIVASNISYRYSGELDLSGYSLQLIQEREVKNIFSIALQAVNTRTGNIAAIERFTGHWEKVSYTFLQGYFQRFDFPHLNDSITVRLDNWLSGSVTLVNPRIQVLIQNSFGFPVTARFSNFHSSSSAGSFELQGEITNKGYNAGPSTLENPSQNVYEANGLNSNLIDFFSIKPDKISYQLTMAGDFTTDFSKFHYITDTSRLSIDVSVEIPLECSINNALLRDTVEVKVDSIRQLTSLDLKMTTENSFPYSIQLQVYFVDEHHHILDSLFSPSEEILSSGLIDDKGVVIRPVEKVSRMNLSSTRLQNLFRSSAMIVQARVVTFSEGKRIVRYTADNGLKIKIGMITGVTP